MKDRGLDPSIPSYHPKYPKAKPAQPLQYSSINLDPKEFSMKQVSQRYSSQLAQENSKKIQNPGLQSQQKNGKYVFKENVQGNNCQIPKSNAYAKMKREAKERHEPPKENFHQFNQFNVQIDLHNPGAIFNKYECEESIYERAGANQMIPQIHLNQRQSLDANKNPNLKFFNNLPQNSIYPVQSQSPKPLSATRPSERSQPGYDKLISSQQALEMFSHVENNRNSQPPLQYNSYNPPPQKLIQNMQKKAPVQSKTKPKSSEYAHKKSQSLFNKKLVDLIASLQQSLGVISNNVKNNYTNDEISNFLLNNLVQGDQKKALVESAMLAQKLAQMTSGLASVGSGEERKSAEAKKKKKSIEKSKLGSNKTSQKTIDDNSDGMLSQNLSGGSNRQSVDPMAGLKSNLGKLQAHSRTKSELQNSRKSGVAKTQDVPYQNLSTKLNNLMSEGQDQTIQGQGGVTSLTSSQYNQLTKSVEDQNLWKCAFSNIPISTKNKKANRFKKKSTSSKGTNLSNQRGSISYKQSTKLSCERLSDATALSKLKKKVPGNGNASLEHKLHSVASSPTLHSQAIDHKKNYNKLKVNGSKNTIELLPQKQKKSQEKEKEKQVSNHKRCNSDANSVTKMFHFKQQMMLNKLLCKGTQSHQVSVNDQLGKGKASVGGSIVNSMGNSVAAGSGIGSKRPSNEERYVSPRGNFSKVGSQRDAQSEMKNLLSRFQKFNGNSQPGHSNIQLIQSSGDTLSSYGVTRGSTTMGSTQSSLPHKSKGQLSSQIPQSHLSQKGCQGSQGFILYNPQVQNIQVVDKLGSGHKRAKSEVNFQLDLAQAQNAFMNNIKQKQTLQPNLPASNNHQGNNLQGNSQGNIQGNSQGTFQGNSQGHLQGMSQGSLHGSKSGKVQSYIPTMKNKDAKAKNMFILNMNPIPTLQILAQEQEIYSSRVSPSSRGAYVGSEKEDSCRSQKISTAKVAVQTKQKALFSSNQTTQRKETHCASPSDFETPQFNYPQLQGLPSHPSYRKPHLEINTTHDEEQMEASFIQQNELVQGPEKKSHINQSPRLKIVPTPKAVQPGVVLHSAESKNEEPVRVSLCSNALDDDHKQMETFESNFTRTNLEALSPRSREKHRIQKLIKVSFRKFKEAPKTTPDYYRIGKMLGKGAFGRVNLAIHKLTEQLVAVKSINKHFLSEDEESQKKVMQEFIILQKIRHKNIVKLFDSFQTNKHIVFAMELCAGGDLLNYVRKRRKLKEDLAKYIFKQVVEGLEYCHAKGIVHRDIKLDNLLLDSTGQVKICDFGVSKLLEDTRRDVMQEQCGTPAYIAPEILKDKGYRGFGVDIWSLGVCLYAMLYGTVPFKANNMADLHQLIIKAKYSLKDDKVEVSEEAKGLIRALLEPEPSKRLTIQQVKQHLWLEDVESEVEVFSEEEKMTIRKDFSYQDMRRYRRNEEKEDLSTEHLFTEHELDTTQNGLIKNNSTKSQILAPFNSTRSHIEGGPNDSQGEPILPPLEIEEELLADRRVIRFEARVKDVNRQYEINNNCELDNGVYNKFVRQSTQQEGDNEENKSGENMFFAGRDQENSLLSSINEGLKKNLPQAPMASQNSEEEAEAELIKNHKNRQLNDDYNQIQSFLETRYPQAVEEEQLDIDMGCVEQVEEFGYPQEFILQSLEHFELNDAATCYFLLEKDRHSILSFPRKGESYFN